MTDNDVVIQVENLSKVYKLYDKPIDRLKESLHYRGKKYHKDFYALSDVGFKIKKGETVGIIGKNGSGKSTLLKIITGVLTPTTGNVTVNGKVSALLELGAGFNPEYTGLENIYFQGAIMGYERHEIDAKIEDILTFAEIGEFIHQPVKTYSSGMFARLAFAVAINVEPDILIVDEALSVGDAAFQNKCIRHMERIMKNGVTVLFVSHDTQAVSKFCTKVIWLKDGIKFMYGDAKDIIKEYLAFTTYGLCSEIGSKKNNVKLNNSFEYLISTENLECFGDGGAKILRVGFLDNKFQPTNILIQGDWVTFICEMEAYKDLYGVAIGLIFKDRLNNQIFTFNSYMYNSVLEEMNAGCQYITKVNFKVPKIFPGKYAVTVSLSDGGTQLNHSQQHWIHTATVVEVTSCDMVDACFLTLYQDEVKYHYEQI